MKVFKNYFFIFFIIFFARLHAQTNTIAVLDSGKNTSLRGLSVVDDNIIWASGSNGTVTRSLDGGKTFEWLTVQGFEQRDFRDIEAFDANTALIMAVAEPAIILKTKDGGKSWNKVFEDSTKGMFLDAMGFANDSLGIVIGDPVNSTIFLGFTKNAGDTWSTPSGDAKALIPTTFPDEAFFAASGTNIFVYKSDRGYNGTFVSGGSVSRIFYENQIKLLPLAEGKQTTGANSIDIDIPGSKGIVVGGDFANDKDTAMNCVLLYFTDSSIKFYHPKIPPHGYRSCVAYITSDKLITCGTSGVDISEDGGFNWELISGQSFHVCQKAKNGDAVFLAGVNGKIAKLE